MPKNICAFLWVTCPGSVVHLLNLSLTSKMALSVAEMTKEIRRLVRRLRYFYYRFRMACSIVRLNSLPSLWYVACLLAIQSYLLYLAFERYRLYTEIKWPNNVYPTIPLTIYISLCGACIPLLFLFFVFGIFKTGNLANDNKKLDSKDKHFLHQVRERSKFLKKEGVFGYMSFGEKQKFPFCKDTTRKDVLRGWL